MQHYKQTTSRTSGPSSLLMVLNHFNPLIKLNRKNEYDIWLKSAVLPTKGSSIYALAMIANQKGVKTKIVVGDLKYKFPNYRFKGYKLKEIKEASYTSKLYYNKALKEGLEIEEEDFSLNDVKENLKQGKFVMLRLDVGTISEQEHEVNYMLITNFKNKKFEIMDPTKGKVIVKEKDVRQAFDDVVTKRKRDHRMIVFG